MAQAFEAELAKHGVKSQMPPEPYTDREFEWRAPGKAEGGVGAGPDRRAAAPTCQTIGASIDSRTGQLRAPVGPAVGFQQAIDPSIPGLEVIGCSL